jgi:tetratricopeptide (TPR) repeat protein
LSFVVLRAGGGKRLLQYGSIGFALLAAAIAAASLLIHQTPVLQQRAAATFTPDTGRLDIWQAAIAQWKHKPIFGTGSGTFLFYGREFRPESLQVDPIDVHNDYLHLLGEYGAVGGILFLIFHFAHLRAGWRTFANVGPRRVEAGTLLRSNRLALSVGALSAIAAYVIHSGFDFNMHIPANALVVAFVFGILANSGADESAGSRSTIISPLARIAAFGVALILVVQAVRLIPGEYYAEQAAAALRQEYPGTAIVLAQRALKFEQRNPYIFFYLGRAFRAAANDKRYEHVRTELFERALSAFDRARLLSPLDGTYPLDMALIYDALGRFTEAEWMYYLARARDPRSTDVENLYRTHLELWANNGASAR